MSQRVTKAQIRAALAAVSLRHGRRDTRAYRAEALAAVLRLYELAEGEQAAPSRQRSDRKA